MELNYFDIPAMRAQLAALVCRYGHVGGMVEVAIEGPHFGAIKCLVEGDYIDWAAAPRQIADAKDRRPSRRPRLPDDDDYCWICNLTPAVLRRLGGHLMWAHKKDRAALIHAGMDPMDDDQMRVCDYHHRWIDAERQRMSLIAGLLITKGVA